jgi:hypothetical protein
MSHDRRLSILKAILAASIVSTGIHYTHNYVKVAQYPQSSSVSNGETRLGIVILWPLLTAVGLVGYRLYAQGRLRPAHLCLALYSAVGISTLGHFLVGNPQIPAFFYATLFTDGLLGFAVLGFTFWSLAQTRVAAPPRSAMR